MKMLIAGVAVLLVGCAGVDTAPMPMQLAHGIVSGQHQVVTAGAKTLASGVTEQLVRNATGALTLRRVRAPLTLDIATQSEERPWGAAPNAPVYDGTVVNGAPVVGAVVCAIPATGVHGLVAFVPCTNTDSAGHATFFFSPQTAAGVDSAEIRGTVTDENGTVEPAVFDTAFATVNAGAVSGTYQIGPGTVRTLPAVVTDSSVQDAYGNPIPFRIVDTTGVLVLADTTFGSVGSRTIVSGPEANTGRQGEGFVVELRAADGTLLGHARYEISMGKLFAWLTAGVDVPGAP